MDQRDGWHVDDEPAANGQAPAQIDVLVVGRETLVERPGPGDVSRAATSSADPLARPEVPTSETIS
jgi:hypothetical protein